MVGAVLWASQCSSAQFMELVAHWQVVYSMPADCGQLSRVLSAFALVHWHVCLSAAGRGPNNAGLLLQLISWFSLHLCVRSFATCHCACVPVQVFLTNGGRPHGASVECAEPGPQLLCNLKAALRRESQRESFKREVGGRWARCGEGGCLGGGGWHLSILSVWEELTEEQPARELCTCQSRACLHTCICNR
jgi:hypothetical protein